MNPLRDKAKRLLWVAVFFTILVGVGGVGGVLYPYTEVLFNQDLSPSQSSDHVDTMMIDNADMAWERASWGAAYMVGMGALVMGVRVFRRREED